VQQRGFDERADGLVVQADLLADEQADHRDVQRNDSR